MPVSPEDLARRLRAAREHVGLTQADAAAAVDLPRTSLVQIENGNRAVSSVELARLAHAYSVSITALLAEHDADSDPVSALFRSDGSDKERAALLAVVRHYTPLARAATDLEGMLELDVAATPPPTYPQPRPRSKIDAVRQGERVAAAERARLGLGVAPIASIDALLETQCVRVAHVALPAGISGFVLTDASLGVFVAVARYDSRERQRFSLAHEYAHVLMDRERRGLVSRVSESDDLVEVRANAFAACLLLPEEGVRAAVAALGKGEATRPAAELVGTDDRARSVEGRRAPGSQAIQLYDVVRIAHAFGASRISTIFRLANLHILTSPEADALRKADEERGAKLARELGFTARDADPQRAFDDRFIALALEAYRRDQISRSKLDEYVALTGRDRASVRKLLHAAGLDA